MKYTYTLNGFRRTSQGRPDVRFTCCHCGKLSLNLVSFFWRARLDNRPCVFPEEACIEFVEKINRKQFKALFYHPSMMKACSGACCHCPDNPREQSLPKARGSILRRLEQQANNRIEGAK
ncbi:hypothetical protein [Arsenophonus nasoniae]|uniref:hypothetical protein n=1 Tax=Arsenophonus nasoniae TaxID=638 RepID=UPI00387A3479